MPRQSITWLTTDTHFYHDAMVKACGRPENFNPLIQTNWKRFIAKQDLLIHLGDVIFYQYPLLSTILSSIECRKVLTMGNHDAKTRGWYMRNGFDFVCDSFVLDRVVFSHHPMPTLPHDVDLNIHGHWHNNRIERASLPAWHTPTTHRLLCLEDEKYMPVNLSEFLNRKK